ncbi:MAG: apolipoprotein N-acyltransferase [Clostridia bacterium]|nr:apolipoprotein N-acyltransferase [Clostridia bacterium]
MKDRIQRLSHPERRGRKILYLIFSGLLMGTCVSFPTAVGAVAEWIAFVPAALVLYSVADSNETKIGKKGKRRRAKETLRIYGLGLLFFMTEYIVIYHWFISMYPLDFTGMSRGYAIAVVLLGCLGMSFLAAAAGGLAFVLFVSLSRLRTLREHTLLRPFTAAALYTVFEWTMTHGWTGVPWGRLSLGQLVGNFTLTVMPASILGSYLITFLIVSVSFLAAQGLYEDKLRLRSLLALSLVFADLIAGTVLFFIPTSVTGENGEVMTVKAAAVQGNISSRDKWDSGSSGMTLERYTKYTEEAAKTGADVVLWPETAYPYVVSSGGENEKTFEKLARDCKVTLFVGCFDFDKDNNFSNVIRSFNSDGSAGGEYAKRRLVPFGEYLPWRPFFEFLVPPLTELSMLSRDIVPGDDATVICAKTKNGNEVRYGVLVCFDSIYENLARESVKNGAEIILLSTNDSWFGESCAVWMHERQARLRAIENARPIIRAANTGVSSVIDAKGRVKERLQPLVEGIAAENVEISHTKTPYTAVGNILVWLCILGLGALPAFDLIKKRSSDDFR